MFDKDEINLNFDEETTKAIAECDCDCDDEDCDCESDTITLDMEDGTQKEFNVLDIIELDSKKYIALAEIESMEYDILRMEVMDDTVELSIIDDESEFEKVAAKFDELFAIEDEEEEAE
ncbi:MAG: DUF1292 domain-containing protein [Candidatus Cloacimonadaceae bacterium]|nr:DUF1292 domain-containing protein [Candidatus Cloacimonadaceae bacterium]MDP3113682.1 DUF1292 domain-containing protein [Candidatus Cloacimonadaceae bacterium]